VTQTRGPAALASAAAFAATVGVVVAAIVAAALLGWHAQNERAAVPQAAQPADLLALGFTPPAAGTYQLERILRTPDGPVLDSDGSAHPLRAYTTGRITLFSFIYTYCTDARGCPLAYATLHAVRAAVATDPALRNRVRLVSMSFDPVNDTPAMMRSYGGDDARRDGPAPWHFLTTASTEALAPLLAGFGQDVAVIAPGRPGMRAPLLSHLLKVYLIDDAGTVREIYATAYLHPRILLNDIRTLLAEGARARA
jgi:protein SCO1/2